jgi:hypothetical protein
MGAPPPARPRPPARTDAAFAIGSRALMTATRPGAREIPLTNEDGIPIDAHLPVDAQVMITAWRPRRAAPPRYRVCADRVEGWVDAANLRRLPPPPPPAPMAVAAPVAAPKPPAPRPAPRARAAAPAAAPRKAAKAATPKAPAGKAASKAKTSRPVRKRAR